MFIVTSLEDDVESLFNRTGGLPFCVLSVQEFFWLSCQVLFLQSQDKTSFLWAFFPCNMENLFPLLPAWALCDDGPRCDLWPIMAACERGRGEGGGLPTRWERSMLISSLMSNFSRMFFTIWSVSSHDFSVMLSSSTLRILTLFLLDWFSKYSTSSSTFSMVSIWSSSLIFSPSSLVSMSITLSWLSLTCLWVNSRLPLNCSISFLIFLISPVISEISSFTAAFLRLKKLSNNFWCYKVLRHYIDNVQI